MTKEELENKYNQKYFFKYKYIDYPNISYLDIIYQLNHKFNIDKIYFTEKQFINMKYMIKWQNEFNNKRTKIKKFRLRCTLEYASPEKKEYMYRLGTKESLKLLKEEKSMCTF